MSGYTLKTRYFDRSIAHFWPADQAQIYRTLQNLESKGAVQAEIIENDHRPNRRVYALTETGEQDLTHWLAGDQTLSPQKDSFLVQLYFGRLLSSAQIRQVLTHRRAAHVARLEDFETMELPQSSDPEMQRQLIFGGLTLDFARRRDKMMIEWLDHCLAVVSELD